MMQMLYVVLYFVLILVGAFSGLDYIVFVGEKLHAEHGAKALYIWLAVSGTLLTFAVAKAFIWLGATS